MLEIWKVFVIYLFINLIFFIFRSSYSDLKFAVKELKEKYGLIKDDGLKNLLRSLSCFEDIFKEQA